MKRQELKGSSFFVLLSNEIGGAERRFYDIFTSIRRAGNSVYLIAPETLVSKLMEEDPRPDLAGSLIGLRGRKWNRFAVSIELAKEIRKIPRNCSFHYPMNCLWFLHLFRGHAVTCSITTVITFPKLTFFDLKALKMWVLISGARWIDVLNPTVYRALQNTWFRRRTSLTPGGTYLVPADTPFQREAKTSTVLTVAWFGRLVEQKGILKYLDVVESVYRNISTKTVRFAIFGYGVLESEVEARTRALASKGVPITFFGRIPSISVYQISDVIISTQDISNYPSRIVAEALVNGCTVLIRNTGDSENFGHDIPRIQYVKDPMSGKDIAHGIEKIVAVRRNETNSAQIQEAIRNKYSSDSYIDYFRTLTTPRL